MHMYKAIAGSIIKLANGLNDNEQLQLHMRGPCSDGINPIIIRKPFTYIKRMGFHWIIFSNNREHVTIINLNDITRIQVRYINNPYINLNPVGFE